MTAVRKRALLRFLCVSAFVSEEPGAKEWHSPSYRYFIYTAEIDPVLLHELAHIYCLHNELDGASFYNTYCEGFTDNSIEDGQINAGYGVWRECIRRDYSQRT
jgi:hypothetical protein